MHAVDQASRHPCVATTGQHRRVDLGRRPEGRTEIAVAGGATVWVRALEPTDRDALASAFERLSEQSRTQRFLSPKTLTDRDLTRLSDIDHVKHEALAAIDPADQSIVGVARYCASSGQDDQAELAGAVVDDWQGRGIGGELLAGVIERARANGLSKLTASAFSDNAPALLLLTRAGFVTTGRCYGVSELHLAIASQPANESSR
jgi:RimJ/RimL family protein N-acetyltransferase